MKISIAHKEAMKFEATTVKSRFIIDCPTISPIEYFLSGIIACSASDVYMLPQNQGKIVRDLVVDGEVKRADEHPKKFETLHLTYTFNSDADSDDQAARWVMASVETYCSTINTIRDTTKIAYTIVHNGSVIRENEEMISGQGTHVELGDLDACCPS